MKDRSASANKECLPKWADGSNFLYTSSPTATLVTTGTTGPTHPSTPEGLTPSRTGKANRRTWAQLSSRAIPALSPRRRVCANTRRGRWRLMGWCASCPEGDIPGLSVRHSCAKSLCFGGVRCGVLWHETAGQGVSGAAELSLVLRSGRRGRRFKSGHLDQLRRYATPARQAHRRETTSRAVPVGCIQMGLLRAACLPRDAVVPRFVTDTVWFALRIVEICSPARSAL